MAYLTTREGAKSRSTLQTRKLALTGQTLGPNHVETAISHHNLAQWHERRHGLAGAERHYTAVNIKERAVPDLPSLANSLKSPGALLYRTKRYSEALPILNQAYDLYKRHFGPAHAATKSAQALRVASATRIPSTSDT